MLTIRLSRVGKKKQPTYRLIISEKHKDPWGDYLELLGNYDPRAKVVKFKADRIKYWISQGATTSDTVNNMLIDQKIIEGAKRRIVSISRKRQATTVAANAKRQDEQKKADEKADAAKAAAQTPGPEAEPTLEALEAQAPAV